METTSKHFGFVVAYLLPGFIVLAGVARFVPLVGAWLKPSTYAEASLGPPIYAILAATTLGMIANALRWLVVDHIHSWTGIRPPIWDDSRLGDRLDAFNYLVENHYRYYQFVANTLIAILWSYAINRFWGTGSFFGIGTDATVALLCAVLFVTSRDTLRKYYTRTARLIGQITDNGGNVMHNGNDHGIEGGASGPQRPEAKPAATPQKPAQPAEKAKPVQQKK